MKVVIDTNALISALINPTSIPAKVLELIEAQKIKPFMSLATQDELCRVRAIKESKRR